jgi:pseudouridine synthase, RluA family
VIKIKMEKEYEFEIESTEANQRLDIFLTSKLENFSRSHIQNLIKNNFVSVNKKLSKANYILKINDKVIIKIPAPTNLSIEAENIPLDIIYEDNQIMIINKQQGMVVHPGAGNFSGTLVNALLFHCKNLSGINGVLRPGIVHRIDKNTSGLIVIAKNDAAHNFLSWQFENHTINREYIAIAYGNIYENGTIDKPIGRNPNDRKKMAINKNGRTAITHYEVIENFKGYTLLKLKLETGRTHQIRVHMASINHPLLGDDVYAAKDKIFGLKGQVLHARLLGFIHPTTKSYIEFEQEPPEYFIRLIEKLRHR